MDSKTTSVETKPESRKSGVDKRRKKKQRWKNSPDPGLPQNGKTLATVLKPNLKDYHLHRRRFGVPDFDRLEDMRVRAMVKDYAVELAYLRKTGKPRLKKSGDIPFNWARLLEGTQNPTVRLYYQHDDVNTTSGTNVADVFPIQGSSLLDWTDFAGVFQEYRFIGGEMWYVSCSDCNTTSGATAAKYLGTGVVVVDYDNAGAITTFDNGIRFDTKEFFNLFHQSTKPKAHVVQLPVWIEPLPDGDWISVTGGGAEDVAWIKIFVEGAHVVPTANEVGFVSGWMDVQWRGIGTG